MTTDAGAPAKISSGEVGRGVLWAYVAFASGKALVFISTVILARFLTPADFGLVGFATIVTGYLGTFHMLGVDEAFIRANTKVEAAANAAFVLSSVTGGVLFVISLILTPVAIIFFNEPRIGPILPTLAFTYVISGVTTVNDVLLVKKLQFQKRTFASLIQSLSKGIGSIVLAVLGFGVWAIVGGILISAVVRAICVWIISPWRPSRAWDKQVAREMFTFGNQFLLLNILGSVEDNFDYLAIGRRLGKEPLGLYTLGFRAPDLLIMNLASVISSVAYPAYAHIQDDLDALRQNLQKAMRLISWLAIPAGIGLAVISPAFVRTFYTDKWEAAIPVMQILAVYSAIRTITYNIGDVYKAIGRPDVILKIGLTTIGITMLMLWFGADYGISGVAWAHLLRIIALGIIEVLVLWHLLKIPPRQVTYAIAAPLGGSLLMALAMVGAGTILHTYPAWLILLTQIIIGAPIYLLSAWFLNRSTTLILWANAQKTFRGKNAAEQNAS